MERLPIAWPTPNRVLALAAAVMAMLTVPASVLYPLVELQSGQSWPAAHSPPPHYSAAGEKTAILLRGAVTDARVRPVVIDGAYRAIGMAKDAAVSGLVVDGLRARVMRECIQIRGDHLTLRNVHCSMTGAPKDSMHELPEGIRIQSGSDVRIENSSFDGFQMRLGPKQYWNGDGVAVERDVTGLVLRDVSADNNTDAGFDIKPAVTMDRVSASGNCRNFRFWSNAQIGTITVGGVTSRGGSSHCAGIWIAGTRSGARPSIHIRNLIVTSPGPLNIIAVNDGAADITIDHCIIHAPPGSKLVKMNSQAGRISADGSCRID